MRVHALLVDVALSDRISQYVELLVSYRRYYPTKMHRPRVELQICERFFVNGCTIRCVYQMLKIYAIIELHIFIYVFLGETFQLLAIKEYK